MMTDVFIVSYPEYATGKPVAGYEIKEADGKVLHQTKTQQGAVEWACSHDYRPHVAWEREMKPDPNNPAHWRKVGCP